MVAVLGLAFAGKTVFELVTGGTIFVSCSPGTSLPVPMAHVVGAGAAAVVWALGVGAGNPWRGCCGEAEGTRTLNHRIDSPGL